MSVKAQEAIEIAESFFNDLVRYPNQDFYLRKGVCKDIGKNIAEEYYSLALLAREYEQEYGTETRLYLFKDGNEGPDGEIQFSSGMPPCKVQITCSNQGYSARLMREQYANKEVVFPNQTRERDKTSKRVFTRGNILAERSALLEERFNRIIVAIRVKNVKYHSDTHTLLVGEDPSNFEYLVGLHEKICEAIQNDPKSPYERIYINFGGDLKRVK